MNNLHEAKHYEKLMKEKELHMNSAMILRDCFILDAFIEGFRQKEIANYIGLSESRIKHIICKMRRIV
jgi:hypothetical protein